MSNQITETKNVWKPGWSGDIEFANIRLLERQEPKTCEKIKWVEGFTVSDFSNTYLVGLAKWVLWLSRKATKIDQKLPDILNTSETILPKTTQNDELVVDATLEARIVAIENWIKKISDSCELNH